MLLLAYSSFSRSAQSKLRLWSRPHASMREPSIHYGFSPKELHTGVILFHRHTFEVTLAMTKPLVPCAKSILTMPFNNHMAWRMSRMSKEVQQTQQTFICFAGIHYSHPFLQGKKSPKCWVKGTWIATVAMYVRIFGSPEFCWFDFIVSYKHPRHACMHACMHAWFYIHVCMFV
jgi:hypothetical protein